MGFLLLFNELRNLHALVSFSLVLDVLLVYPGIHRLQHIDAVLGQIYSLLCLLELVEGGYDGQTLVFHPQRVLGLWILEGRGG